MAMPGMGNETAESALRRLMTSARGRTWLNLAPAAGLLLALALAGTESFYWWISDFPGAPWKLKDPGAEISIVFRRLPVMSAGEIFAFWYGRAIHENDYYQPLSSWLMVAQYHWFERDHRRFMLISLAAHMLVCALLYWCTALFSSGSRAARAGSGVAAVLLFSGPLLADRVMYGWVLTWWPAQPDIFSLLFGLLHLIAVRCYASRPSRSLAAAALAAFVTAVLFKETAFAAGVGGCLLLLRRRRSWPLLAAIAASGIGLFVLRAYILGAWDRFGTASSPARVPGALLLQILELRPALVTVLIWAAILIPCLAAWFCQRSRFTGRLLYLLSSLPGILIFVAFFPSLNDPLLLPFLRHSAALILGAIWLAGLVWALRRWPAPELLLFSFLCQYLSLSFAATFAWHRYWAHASVALLTAACVAPAALHLAQRLRQRPMVDNA